LINRAVPQRERPLRRGTDRLAGEGQYLAATIPARASSLMEINFGGPR
jgi:hypothetical protein